MLYQLLEMTFKFRTAAIFVSVNIHTTLHTWLICMYIIYSYRTIRTLNFAGSFVLVITTTAEDNLVLLIIFYDLSFVCTKTTSSGTTFKPYFVNTG